jgi:hypothetical protein
MDEAEPQRLVRVEGLGGQHVAARGALADRADDIGADHRRDQAKPHLRDREARALRGDRDVAARHEPASARDRRAMHRRDGRLGQLVERAHQPGQRLGVAPVLLLRIERHALHPVEVRAGGEAPALAREDDDTHAWIGLEAEQRLGERRDERVVERVVELGPIQHQPPDATLRHLDPQSAGHSRLTS